IEKDTEINSRIEQFRLEATSMLLSGEPTIIVATVSCIYSLGSPQEWKDQSIILRKKMIVDRRDIIKRLLKIRYERNDLELKNGTFSVKGDLIEIIPGYSDELLRISLFAKTLEKITIHDKITKNFKKE